MRRDEDPAMMGLLTPRREARKAWEEERAGADGKGRKGTGMNIDGGDDSAYVKADLHRKQAVMTLAGR